jgi:hypothetical protein
MRLNLGLLARMNQNYSPWFTNQNDNLYSPGGLFLEILHNESG